MAGYRVGVAPRAIADIARIAEWWRENRASAPRMFQNELDRSLLRIATHPHIGAIGELRAYPGARTFVLSKSGYLVLYNVDDDAGEVIIARVRHMHRRPLPKQRRQ